MSRYQPRHGAPPGRTAPRGLSAAVAAGSLAVAAVALSGSPASAATLDRHELHLLHLEREHITTTALVTVSGIAAYAEQFASPGHYYQYGGEGPYGFDCSGLAQVVYAHFGIHIPRTADEQAGYLHPTSSPQPGDLVFYWGGNYAYHTAIYLGRGMVVSALNPAEGIRVTPVSWPGPAYSFGTMR